MAVVLALTSALAFGLGGFAGLVFLSAVISVNIILGSAHLPRAGATKAEVLAFFGEHDAVIGLTTAIRLAESGATTRIVTADDPERSALVGAGDVG